MNRSSDNRPEDALGTARGVSIRPFLMSDAPKVDGRFGGKAAELIAQWRTGEYRGRFFEMLAVTAAGSVVGTVSLYQHSDSVVSLGVEIFEEYRRLGYGSGACELAIARAGEMGYKIAMDQVRADNGPSIALHRGLGFENDGYLYKNQKGKDVLIFVKSLVRFT